MKWFLRSSIAKSLLASFLAVLVPFTLISLLVNYISLGIVRNEVTTSYSNTLIFMTRQLDNSLRNMETLSSSLVNNQTINMLNYGDYEYSDMLLQCSELLDQLKFYAGSTAMDCRITVYLRNKNLSLSSRYGMEKIQDTDREEFFGSRSALAPKWFFGKVTDPRSGTQERVLSLVSNNTLASKSNIVIKVDIYLDQIRSVLGDLQDQAGGVTFLANTEKDAVFSTESRAMDKSKLVQRILKTEVNTGQFIFLQDTVNYRVIFNKSGYSGLVFGMYYPDAQVMRPIGQIVRWIVIIFFAALAFGILFTFLSYRNLLLPVHRLIDGMRQVRDGNLKVRISGERKAELGFMFAQFNKMVERMDTLVNEVYMERFNRQQVQLKLLQSQINPHFLYNCLNFIYQMSMGENNRGAAKMSLYLGKYFRFATKSNRDTVTLLEEVDNVESYMQIQKMRYPDKFDYKITIDETVMNQVIPRLIIQPIVENAFVHGLEGLNRLGHIWLQGEMNGDNAVISIEDDGKGITAEKLDEIARSLEHMGGKDSGFGVGNTHWRLKLYYGEDAGIHIEPRQDGGTKVVLIIPYRKEEAADVQAFDCRR